MKDYTKQRHVDFLTFLRNNPAYQTAITELDKWSLVVKVIDSLEISYTEAQLKYVMKKDWYRGFPQASMIVLKLNQNPKSGMVYTKIMSDIFNFGIRLDSESETSERTLNALLNRHSDNGTSVEAQARKSNGEYKYKKYFTIVDTTETPRRYKLKES